jgi:uncharacterized membrane protein
MNRWLRLLKHRLMDETDSQRALPPDAVARIEARVRQSESRHSGEIRVCVEAGLPLSYLWRGLGAHDRAVMMFGKLRVWDTADNNGVLIYLLLADHAIEVVADRGLNRHVDPARWAGIVGAMREPFRQGRFEQGLMAALDAVDGLLAQHYPLAEGQRNPNELPDAPLLR